LRGWTVVDRVFALGSIKAGIVCLSDEILRPPPRAIASASLESRRYGSNMSTDVFSDGATAMTITTLSSREFNQDTSRAKKAAKDGPVFITDRGTPAHVLLSIEEYQRLTGTQDSIIDSLGLPPGIEDVELDIPPPRDLARPAGFT
jgi:prevent-host-death family protein